MIERRCAEIHDVLVAPGMIGMTGAAGCGSAREFAVKSSMRGDVGCHVLVAGLAKPRLGFLVEAGMTGFTSRFELRMLGGQQAGRDEPLNNGLRARRRRSRKHKRKPKSRFQYPHGSQPPDLVHIHRNNVNRSRHHQ